MTTYRIWARIAPIIFSGGRELFVLDFLGNRLRTIIINMKEAELTKNTAQGAIAVTRKPPIVGPAARPMLLAIALRVRAAGSSDFDTKALI